MAAKYIVGYRNNFGSEYVWRVSLIIPIEGEDDYDQIVLPDIYPESVGEYRLLLDAIAIANEAEKYGLGSCEYMVRVTFVPTNTESNLDFAITLDPHILVLNGELSNIVKDQCTERGTYVYDCALCGAVGVEEKTYGGSHDTYRLHYYEFSTDADNNQQYVQTSVLFCYHCEYTERTVYVYLYTPDGSLISHSVHDYAVDGSINMASVHEYVYGPDGERYTALERYERASDNYWYQYEYEYEYDFDKQIRICTYTNSNGEKRVTETDMNTGNTISGTFYDADGNMIAQRIYEYVENNGNIYISFERYEDSDEYWYQYVYEYDFENGICTETYTDSNGANEIIERSI